MKFINTEILNKFLVKLFNEGHTVIILQDILDFIKEHEKDTDMFIPDDLSGYNEVGGFED